MPWALDRPAPVSPTNIRNIDSAARLSAPGATRSRNKTSALRRSAFARTQLDQSLRTWETYLLAGESSWRGLGGTGVYGVSENSCRASHPGASRLVAPSAADTATKR